MCLALRDLINSVQDNTNCEIKVSLQNLAQYFRHWGNVSTENNFSIHVLKTCSEIHNF